jgi:acyl dehydratase
MTLNASRLMEWPFREVVHSYSDRDSMLYALSLGFGDPPTDERQLRFVYEKALLAVPTMPIVLGMTDLGFLHDTEIGIDLPRMLHGESALEIHAPLPPAGSVLSKMRLVDLVDKGANKGAFLHFERAISLPGGAPLATERGCFVLRGNGGFTKEQSSSTARPEGASPRKGPDRAAEFVCDLPTSARAALLYRLNNDRNPLHADPDVARAAGFDRPILHGSCVYGIAGHAILKAICDYDPLRFGGLAVRFTSPTFPGETIRTEIWRSSSEEVTFRCTAVERNLVVLDQGRAKVAGAVSPTFAKKAQNA